MGARRKQAGLGESWEEAYISSSENTPLHSETSQSDGDLATPLPPKLKQSTLRTRRRRGDSTPNQSTTPAKSRTSIEPDFIMPSMGDDFNRARRPSARATSHTLYRESGQEQTQTTRRRTPRHVRHEYRDDSGHRYGHAQLVWTRILQPLFHWIVKYVAGVIGSALELLMPIFGILLCVVVIVYGMQYSTHALFNNALSRVCYLPGSSYILPLCSNLNTSTKQEIPSPNFEELGAIQAILADVVEANTDSYFVPLNLLKSRNGLNNFKFHVKYSHLPSRAELTSQFTSFITTMDETIDELQGYNSDVSHTADRVIHANKHVFHSLEYLTEAETQQAIAASQNPLSKALSYLNPWSLTPQAAQDKLEHNLYLQYAQHLASLTSKIDDLTQSALHIKDKLTALDEIANVITEIGHQDHIQVKTRQADVKSSLWFGIVGKNRGKLKDFDKMLETINNLFEHRDVAATAVSITIQKLAQVNSGLKRLKEDMQGPRASLDAEDAGWGANGKARGIGTRKPLKYHIELITQATDRLVEVRNANHRIRTTAGKVGFDDNKRQKSLPGRIRDRYPKGF